MENPLKTRIESVLQILLFSDIKSKIATKIILGEEVSDQTLYATFNKEKLVCSRLLAVKNNISAVDALALYNKLKEK